MDMTGRFASVICSSRLPRVTGGIDYSARLDSKGAFLAGDASVLSERLTAETAEFIRDINPRDVTRRQLRDLALRLHAAEEVDVMSLGTLTGLASELDDDEGFDAFSVLNEHLYTVNHSTADVDYSESIRLYEGAMRLALGLRELIRILRPELGFDAYA